ncbi:Protein export cytoplasm protein SecA2 ATPase RNA helicase [Streptococcus sp. DD10]|nr:Protein export cytoplasm protein SecA2 ATPase RNA helicase [Streptococcus sp. DD10]
MLALSDQELQAKTQEFKKRLASGETLDDIMVEAFAVVREADRRVLGMFPYEVQVMGGIVLHQGDVAEMNTGEGKTLTATLPVYLNALSGKGVILVTTNEYLAKRDAEEMGQVYRFLGLSIGVPIAEQENQQLEPEEKRAIYASDIIYTTNAALGFDYLTENLSSSAESQYLPEFNHIIIDEVDAILLDSAQTPLIISGAPRVQSNMYSIIDTLILTFEEERDYKYDAEKKQVWLTRDGAKRAERFLNLGKLYETKNKDLIRHIYLALQAHKNYTKDKEYIVRQTDDGPEIVLLDQSTGRLMELTRLQGGLHQAIEAKERVPLTQETRAMASITYQSLFRKFKKISGMTGTGKVAEAELLDTYDMHVIRIPTNRPRIRKDLPDQLFVTLPEKVFASLEYVKEYHEKGNPLLIFTGSVEMSNIYSSLLLREGIAHNLLNANNAAREAQIIAESGQLGAVTVATSMAGRGTDIKLGPGVAELGGLIVIGTERMENQRIDLQIRGRSGRQGDPGMSQFFISLEDDVVKNFGPAWVKNYYKNYSVDDVQIEPKILKNRKFKNIVEKAQRTSESSGRQSRKMTLEYAQSMNIQRERVYAERNRMLQQGDELDKEIDGILSEVIEKVSKNKLYHHPSALYRYILDNFSYHMETLPEGLDVTNSKAIAALLWDLAKRELDYKNDIFQAKEVISNFQRVAILKSIDENWIEQVDYLQQLRTALASQYSNQRNPLVEFYQESHSAYDRMSYRIKEQIVRNLLLSSVELNKKGEVIMHFP